MDDKNLYHAMISVSRHLQTGDDDATRRSLADMIATFQTDWAARNFASACFERLGDVDRARIEAGIALALEPDNYAACKRVARYLDRDGQREAAQRVLEHGWEQMKKIYPKRRWTHERALYFALSDAELPPQIAEERRLQRAQMEAEILRGLALYSE